MIFLNLSLTTLSSIRKKCSISSDCTFECWESLSKAKETFGCCAMTFFSAVSFGERFYSCEEEEEEDGDIWSHCGIPPPDFCSNSLMLNSHGSFVDTSTSVNGHGSFVDTSTSVNGHGSFVDTSVSVIFAAITVALSYFT